MKPLFSVITATHNRADFLRQNIRSIQEQRCVGFTHEHIIVDNNSTDDTADVVRAFMKDDPRIIYIHNPRNLGPGDALNVGYARATGDLVVPLDDDDMLPLSSLQFRHNFFQEYPDVEWAYGHCIFIDKDNKLWKDLLEYRVTYEEKGSTLDNLFGRNFIPNGTVTIKRDCIKAVGGWDTELSTQDFDMWLKLAHADFTLGYMQSYLCYYRVHPNQLTKLHLKDGTIQREGAYYRKKYGK
ncbi:MAG: glycosyltransferase [Patescibacteria group bacterium]